jgi:hypothetical protein
MGAKFEDLIGLMVVREKGLAEVFYVLAAQRNAGCAELVLEKPQTSFGKHGSGGLEIAVSAGGDSGAGGIQGGSGNGPTNINTGADKGEVAPDCLQEPLKTGHISTEMSLWRLLGLQFSIQLSLPLVLGEIQGGEQVAPYSPWFM